MKQKISAENLTEIPEEAALISVGEENPAFANLAASLAEIRKLKGVNGYILRSNTAAIVDLTEQEKISEYALLATHISESSLEMAKQFNLANMENIVVEGKNAKVLCIGLGENRVDVFMEKDASHGWIVKRIRL